MESGTLGTVPRLLGCAFAAAMGMAGIATAAAPATDAQGLWRDVDDSTIAARGERWIAPHSYRAMALDYSALRAQLARAPMEGSMRIAESSMTLSLPRPDGSYARFAVVESPVMEAALAEKYPNIRTYAGQDLDDPTATVRFDVTQHGFHAQVLSAHGHYYIDPYQLGDAEHYVAYARNGMGDAGKHYRCEVEGHDHDAVDIGRAASAITPNNPAGTNLRTYRIAVAATRQYTNVFGGTVADGLSGIATTVNRVSGIYEREFALRLVLVGNNDAIVFTTANPGPLPNPPSPNTTLNNLINTSIGSANYDIGHAVGTGNGGSITPLGNVCGNFKAQGITAFNPPRGDIFDVDFVAHELGHQLGGDHTWNGCGGGGQWRSQSAMEPGSGSTIMAYAGICGDDLQPNSDAYFHARSFTQIWQNINNGGSGNNNTVCGTVAPTGNTPPSVTAPGNFSIPERTPFQLTASATDADAGDVVTYNWEQVDRGAQGGPSTNGDNGTAPLFRSFNPTTSPTRLFPSLQYILDNQNAPPTNIPWLPTSPSAPFFSGEILPNPPLTDLRVMNFRMTARDNHAGGGGLRHTDNVVVTAVGAAGPFAVDNIAGPLTAGSTHALTWSVAGTDANGINTTQVNVLISLDGGYTFTPLLSGTANDGSESIALPNVNAARVRIRVEAANGEGISPGNTFFDITDSNFAITDAGAPVSIEVSAVATDLISVVQGSAPPPAKNIATVSGGTGPYTATADTYPSNPEIAIQPPVITGGTVSTTAAASCHIAGPNAPGFRIYPAILKVTDNAGRTASAVFPINVSNNELPTVGTYANQTTTRGAVLTVMPASPPSDPNDNFTGMTVTPATLQGGGTVTVDAAGVVTITTTATTALQTHTIRVYANDSCGAQGAEQFTVNVTTPDPVLGYNGSAVTSGNNQIDPGECNTINVTLGNTGGSGATAISSTLTSTTTGVTIDTNTSAYPNIGAGGTGVNTTQYQISTEPTIACGTTIALTQTVNYSGAVTPSVLNFTLPVGAAPPAACNIGPGTCAFQAASIFRSGFE